MFPKIFFDQIFRRRNEIELTVDAVFLKCAKDTVFTTISKCMKSQIITIEHFCADNHYSSDVFYWRVSMTNNYSNRERYGAFIRCPC